MSRFVAAWKAFWSILTSEDSYRRWREALPEAEPETAPEAAGEPEVPAEPVTERADAVYTLVLLQRAGRFVDFLQEDIAAYPDKDVGTAAKQLHASCRKVLEEVFQVEPIHQEPEKASVTVPEGFDPRAIRITGHPRGEPPYEGVLQHCGWRVTKIDLPERHQDLDPTVICPAEVSVGH